MIKFNGGGGGSGGGGNVVAVKASPFTVSRGKWYQGALSPAASETDITFKVKYEALADCSDLQFEYGNFFQDDDPVRLTQLKPLTLNATLEIGTMLYDMYFGTQGMIAVIPVGGQVKSDPIGIELRKGDTFFVRSHIITPSDSKFPHNVISTAGNGEGKLTGDHTRSTTTFPSATLATYAPLAIYGTPLSKSFEAIACIGDSISIGANHEAIAVDGHIAGEVGFMQIAAMRSNRGFVSIGMNGQTSEGFRQNKRFRRMALASKCNVAIVNYGTNDLAQQRTLASIQADLLDIWKALKLRGLKVYQTTITPRTTSTDAWATVANQTPINAHTAGGNTSQRSQLNDWIRSKPSADLDGFIEIADLTESARNSGLWKVGTTPDGIHPNTATHQAMADLVVETIGQGGI